MTRAAWFYAICGTLVFIAMIWAIQVDVMLVVSGQETISRWHMKTGFRHPGWFPLLVVAGVLLPVGGFIGHYWSPGNVPFWDTFEVWGLAVAASPVILLAGVLLGRWLVAQTL